MGATDSHEDIENQVVLPIFQQCPHLERIISHSGGSPPYYTTFTVLRSEMHMEVKATVTEYEHNTSCLW